MRLLLSFFIILNFLHAKPTVVLDVDIAAIVNGVKITKISVDRGVTRLFPTRYMHARISEEKINAFKKDVLDELIEEELLFQYAKSIGIYHSIDEIDKAIEDYKKTFKNSEVFQDSLTKSGWTVGELRDAIYKDNILKKFHNEKIATNLNEKDLREYYDNNLHKFREPEKISVNVIYVKNNPTDPNGKTKAKKRVEEAYKKVKDGENFADVAAKYSTAMSRINGGDLGYLHKGMLEPKVEKIAYAMDVGKVSEIIELDMGFYIVKVNARSESKQLSFDSVKKRLAIDLKKKLEKEKKEKLLKRLMSTAVIIK